jgi:hypothetical protein
MLLLIFNSKQITTDNIYNEFKKNYDNLKFIFQREEHNKINYLGITLHRIRERDEMQVHWVPTLTDDMNNKSMLPHEHETATLK